MAAKNKNKIRDTIQDRVMYAVINTILILFSLCVLFPLINVLASSFSSSVAVTTGKVFLWPVDFSLAGYEMIFSHKLILSSYSNTFFYTIVGTINNMIVTIFAAYPLSRKELPFRNLFMTLIMITMFFSGGLVPYYLLMNSLHLINTPWVMILPGLTAFNVIILRTAFHSIPEELYEAAQIDGCSYWKYLIRVMIPLAKPTISVLTLFYAVGNWNRYFEALIFLKDRSLFPLQVVLREILTRASVQLSDMTTSNAAELANMQGMAELIKYALIVVATVPILIVYPFIQRYFVKGVMVGSLKG